MPIVGLIAGVGGRCRGHAGRRRAAARCLPSRFGSDLPAGLIEDAVAIVAALLDRVVGVMSRAVRRDHRRHGPGRPVAGRPADRGRHDGGHRRAQACRWNLRQHRLQADQDDGRQRLCGAYGAPRRRFRRLARRRNRRRRHEGGQGAQGRGGARVARRIWRPGSPAWRSAPVLRGHARLASPRSVTVDGETLEAERIFLNVGGRRRCRTCRASTRSRSSPTPRSSSSIRCRSIWWWSAAAISASNSPRCSAASESKVTVIEKGPRLIGREDADVSDAIRDFLEAEGIAVRLAAECIRFAATPGRRHRRRRLRNGRAGSDRQPCAARDGAASQHGRSGGGGGWLETRSRGGSSRSTSS